MRRKTKRRSQRTGTMMLGNAIDLMLSGAEQVITPDFLMTRRNGFGTDNAEIGYLPSSALNTYDQVFIDHLCQIKGEKNNCSSKASAALLQEYLAEREQLCDYQNKLAKIMLAEDIPSAKELGNFDSYGNVVVIRNEAELNVFCDYIALYRKINKKRAITQWRLDTRKYITAKNDAVAMAFENATFAVLRLEKNLDHGAIKATNVITEKECLLMDRALNQSDKEGCFFICSLLDMGKYSMTSGGGIPIDPASNIGKSALSLLQKHMDKIQKSRSPINLSIMDCVKEIYGFCLRSDILRNMAIQ